MFCSNCSKKNRDEARFCVACGNQLKRNEKNTENTIKMNYVKDLIEDHAEIEEVYKVKKSGGNKGIIALIIISIIVTLGGGVIGYNYIGKSVKPEVASNTESKAPEKEDDKVDNSKVTESEEDKVDKNNVDYILPESDSKVLSSGELSNFSKENLAFARNEIYARYGYIFKSEIYSDYFNSKSWYTEDPSFSGNESEFNSYEKANIKLIKSLEEN